jgi:putative transposase
MADELRIGLKELLRKAQIEGDAEFLKEGVRVLSQMLMEMEVEQHIGASRHERSPGRIGQRNGYRQRSWDTRVGSVELSVPRVRDSSYFPSLLEPRVGRLREHWQQSSRKPTSTVSQPAKLTSW